jgi:4-amino-4-deoxy-L-arabinose transferase-like glycosyltransferase
MGADIAEEGLLSEKAGTFRPPLYPLLIAWCYETFDSPIVSLRLIQVVLSTATCWFLFGIAKELYGPTAGVLAGTIFSLYPLCVFFSAVLMAETLLLFCTGLVYWCLNRYCMFPNFMRAISIGICLALGALCKPVMLVWLPGLLAVIYWKCENRSRLMHAFSVLISLFIIILPWTVRNAYVTNHVVPISTNTGINFLVGNEPGSTGYYRDGIDYWAMANEIADYEDDPVIRDTKVIRAVIKGVWREPFGFFRMGVVKVLLLWNPLIEDGSWFQRLVILFTSGPLLLVGILGVWKIRSHPLIWCATLFIVSLTIVHAVFFSHVRFRLPIDLVLIVPAACYLSSGLRGYFRRDNS